jgi:hypothetical protein
LARRAALPARYSGFSPLRMRRGPFRNGILIA